MTWRCTTTSSALVGSSAMITFGRRLMAMRDADALLHAAAELVRVHVGDVRPQPDAARAGRRCASSKSPCAEVDVVVLQTRRRSGRATRMTGLSEFIAPCGDQRDLRQADRAHLLVRQLRQSMPSSRTCAYSIFPADLIRRIRASAIVDLPEPDSPTSPNRSSEPSQR